MLRKLIYILVISILSMIMMAGCGQQTRPISTAQYYNPAKETVADTEEAEGAGAKTSIGTDLYLIIGNDMTNEQLNLKQLASGKQYLYVYSLSTDFLDKYGNSATTMDFEPGRVIHVGKKDGEGRLLQAQIADEVWEYSDITKYSVDTERGIFKIADSKYSYDADLFVESNGEKIRLSDLNEKDEIRVVGIGTKILSVSVTTGQGTLELKNTSVFEGSFIQVGSKIFAQITHNMKLEIPEGTYTVTVANEGYGGSKEVEIARGEICTLDLDELKGEGPKTGSITFYIDVEGATFSIDGDTVDYSAPVVLTYGVHELHAEADGYDDFDKKLFVNSAAANIDISLTSESTTSDNDMTEGTESVEETETAETETKDSEEETKSTEKDSETTDKSTDKDVTSDYLATLSDLITSLNK
ncbi:MAG: hypothetical protein KH093_09180 [Roseburia sp.]|nr:hypothetical protein [Roseburia sp.]